MKKHTPPVKRTLIFQFAILLASLTADKPTASWLINGPYAADWQAFQRDGEIGK